MCVYINETLTAYNHTYKFISILQYLYKYIFAILYYGSGWQESRDCPRRGRNSGCQRPCGENGGDVPAEASRHRALDGTQENKQRESERCEPLGVAEERRFVRRWGKEVGAYGWAGW